MSRYDVNAANTNRLVSFVVDAGMAGAFKMLKGPSGFYPHYGQLTTTATVDEEAAQLRTSMAVRALSVYTIPVGVSVDTTGQFLTVQYEVDQQGEFFNNLWTGDQTLPKNLTADVVDTLGVGGMTTAKTKPGLATLLANATALNYGTVAADRLFLGSAPVLPDGSVATVDVSGAAYTIALA